MLVCYAFEKRSPWFILAFAVACALGAVYGFLQGGVAVRDCGGGVGGGGGAAVVGGSRAVPEIR